MTRSPIPGCYLFTRDRTPEKARFPVVDAHNHLWSVTSATQVDSVVRTMDEVGVAAFCDLTGNCRLAFGDGGYRIEPCDFESSKRLSQRYPGRFYAFTTSSFNQPADEPLWSDSDAFVSRAVSLLREHVAEGARGLKILKELGLSYRDAEGRLIRVDDPRLTPIWRTCAELGVPVLIHQSDPFGFFEPVTPQNEHYDSLRTYPSWSFSGPPYPPKQELLAQRDALVAANPDTTFILPHVANFAENLEYVDQLLRRHANVLIDFSARCDELGRQPYTARRFLIEHQDRVLFGSDMPVSAEMYRFYFRFLETDDEYFIAPDYNGTFGRHRWKVHGLYLPDDVLRKIYYGNAMRVIAGLASERDMFDGA